MTVAQAALLLGAGALAGIVGSAGGTASLISYPALLAVGLPPLSANITNAVAFVAAWPGSALGSRPELRGQGRWLRRWAPLTAAGSAAGAGLLLVTPAAAFDRVVPFLLAFAALALLLQPVATRWVARRPCQRRAPPPAARRAAGVGRLRRLLGRRGGRDDPGPAHDRHRPAARPVQRAQEHAARHRGRVLLHRVHRVLARRLGRRGADGRRLPGRQHDRAGPDQADARATCSASSPRSPGSPLPFGSG